MRHRNELYLLSLLALLDLFGFTIAGVYVCHAVFFFFFAMLVFFAFAFILVIK